MEGKTIVVAIMCMLILLSGQQHQVGAMSKFCKCYRQCYPECRESLPRWLCLPKCLDDCSPHMDTVAGVVATSTAGCRKTCLTSICGTAAPAEATGATACEDDCTRNWSQYVKYL